MIKIENVEIAGFEAAIRGMRNPKNSWHLSDSKQKSYKYELGEKDAKLCNDLAKGGPVHAKYRRMITVWCDITAPLYWWKEFDTYKVGTVANSCSTMHKIQDKEFTSDDFSAEHLNGTARKVMVDTIIPTLNYYRDMYNDVKNKQDWWQMIQLLPSSYNQKRTVMLSYETLNNIYYSPRYNHKLDEWVEFCNWIKTLPYADTMILIHTNSSESTITNEKCLTELANIFLAHRPFGAYPSTSDDMWEEAIRILDKYKIQVKENKNEKDN